MIPKGTTPIVFASATHIEKHSAYGDSWKRRGELLAILANIARKVDRLGRPGAGDSELDTRLDLLVYLAKYATWLLETVPRAHYIPGDPNHIAINLAKFSQKPDSDETAFPNAVIFYLGATTAERPESDEILINGIRADFDALAEVAETMKVSKWDGARHRYKILGPMLTASWILYNRAALRDLRETLSWNPEPAE